MRPVPVPVKAARRYDASGRRERARRAQSHVLEVAEKLFLRDGYAGMFAYTAPDLYDVLVTGRGWTLEMFADFIFRGLCAELLE